VSGRLQARSLTAQERRRPRLAPWRTLALRSQDSVPPEEGPWSLANCRPGAGCSRYVRSAGASSSRPGLSAKDRELPAPVWGLSDCRVLSRNPAVNRVASKRSGGTFRSLAPEMRSPSRPVAPPRTAELRLRGLRPSERAPRQQSISRPDATVTLAESARQRPLLPRRRPTSHRPRNPRVRLAPLVSGDRCRGSVPSPVRRSRSSEPSLANPAAALSKVKP
jgi:hypothetical protein